jgi:hypothetical protein
MLSCLARESEAAAATGWQFHVETERFESNNDAAASPDERRGRA